MPRKKKNLSIEEKRKLKKESEQRRRDRIKADPQRYAEQKLKNKLRRQKRKEQEKIKSITDMTTRQQRRQRLEWRERTRKSRMNKHVKQSFLQRLREDSPPTDSDTSIAGERVPPPALPECPSPTPSSGSDSSRQRIQGIKRAKQTRTVKDRIIEKQKKNIDILKKKVHALMIKNQRLEVPRSLSAPLLRSAKLHPKARKYHERKMEVQVFLENDDNSKMCPGKKDTLTRNGKKKQKRYLCDTMKNLHKKFNSERTNTMGYSTFTRFRPFWITPAKVAERDTCLCVVHENFNLIVGKLRQLRLIKEKSGTEIIDAVVCDKNKLKCMHRECRKCADKVVDFESFDNSETINYSQWMLITETRIIKGKERQIKRTVKKTIDCTKKELIELFLERLTNFLKHNFDIWHQYQAVSHLKKNLSPKEGVLHIDFSENYQCKYASEAQSVHFGASKQQISLHTCVLHYCDDSGSVKTISFCSVSDCLRHDAAAIYAHLKKSLSHLCQENKMTIKTLHVLSDGPSNQYKNKTNLYLFSQHLTKDLGLKQATRNFSISGHGKGAVDGVGAVVKRTADSLIAQGQDIPDYKTFVTKMVVRTNVVLYTVTESDMTDADTLVSKFLKPIPHTAKIHQVAWTCTSPQKLFVRKLSCIKCPLQAECIHYSTPKPSFEFPDIREDTFLDHPSDCESFEVNEEHPIHEQTTTTHEETSSSSPSVLQNDTPLGSTSSDILGFIENALNAKKVQLMQESPIPTIGSWILVQFEGKKNTLHFVGQIVMNEHTDPNELSYVVKFLRKKNLSSASGIFAWQEPEDVSLVMARDIVGFLPEPTPTRRGELVFKFDFSSKKMNIK